MKSGENGLIGPGSNDYGRAEKAVITEYIPKRGHQVWYYPEKPQGFSATKQDCYPAIVIDGDDTYPTLEVFTDEGYEVYKTVYPKSEIPTPYHAHWKK